MRSSRFQLQSFARRWSTKRPSLTGLLIATSIGLACAQWILFAIKSDVLFEPEMLSSFLGLHADTHTSGHDWQFFTFAMLHAGPWHLLANLLPLYFAGREVEPIIGGRHFLGLFFLANLAGGLAQWGAMAAGIAPGTSVFLGISAGVAGLVAAYATILPELEVTVLLFFVLPLRVRAKRLTLLVLLLAAGLWISQVATVAGPAAIIVGCFIGWAYVKQLGFGTPLAVERYFLERRSHALRLQRMPAQQFIVEEMDPVLEKIARQGTASLTRAERRILQQGSAKLAVAKK